MLTLIQSRTNQLWRTSLRLHRNLGHTSHARKQDEGRRPVMMLRRTACARRKDLARWLAKPVKGQPMRSTLWERVSNRH